MWTFSSITLYANAFVCIVTNLPLQSNLSTDIIHAFQSLSFLQTKMLYLFFFLVDLYFKTFIFMLFGDAHSNYAQSFCPAKYLVFFDE